MAKRKTTGEAAAASGMPGVDVLKSGEAQKSRRVPRKRAVAAATPAELQPVPAVATVDEVAERRSRRLAFSNDASFAAVQQYPTRDEIAQRAYEIYRGRGGTHGADLDDWLQAERELMGNG